MLTVGQEEVSHVDIYRALGVLEGKLDAINQSLSQKHTDLGGALTRITELEKAVAKGLGVAITCSIVIPVVVTVLVTAIVPFMGRGAVVHTPAGIAAPRP
jgi:hypothetical protein